MGSNPFHSKPISYGRIKWAIEQSKSLTKASEIIGCSYTTFKKYAKLYDLFYENKNQAGKGIPKRRKLKDNLFDGIDLSELQEILG